MKKVIKFRLLAPKPTNKTSPSSPKNKPAYSLTSESITKHFHLSFPKNRSCQPINSKHHQKNSIKVYLLTPQIKPNGFPLLLKTRILL